MFYSFYALSISVVTVRLCFILSPLPCQVEELYIHSCALLHEEKLL